MDKGCSLKDVPEAMTDRDGWLERDEVFYDAFTSSETYNANEEFVYGRYNPT